MSNYNDGNHTEQNKAEISSSDSTQGMLDFDYSSSFTDAYGKGLEQTIFVDDTNPDLTEDLDQSDLPASSWENGSIGSISDYLNIDKPLVPSDQAQSLSGTVSWETNMTEAESSPISQESLSSSSDEDEYRPWNAPEKEPGHRQGSLNPLYRQGSLHPTEPSLSEPPTPPTPPVPPTPSWQNDGTPGQETGKRPVGKGKKPVLLWVIAAVLAAAVLVTVLNSESRTQYHIGGEQAEQAKSEDAQTEQKESGKEQADSSDGQGEDSPDQNGEQPVNDGYADFYTPKCITTRPVYSGKDYEEACVIDPGALIGTASNPVLPKYDFDSSLDDTRYRVTYFSGGPSMVMGFSVSYLNPDTAYDENFDLTNTEILSLPTYADKDLFFERIRASYEQNASESLFGSFEDLQSSDIKSADISGHKVSYMETTFKGSDGTEIFDVTALEERPEGYGFASVYRCTKSELSKGEDGLQKIYAMLSFYTEDQIPDIDAASGFWPESRIYNADNSQSVLINVSDFIKSGSTYQNEKGYVSFYGGDYENGEVNLVTRYATYKYLNDKSFDDHIKDTLKDLKDYNYKDIQEHARKEFQFDGCDVHYFSYDYVTNYSDPWDYRIHNWLIETPKGEEICLELTYEIKIPDDPDPEAFLKQHITLEK